MLGKSRARIQRSVQSQIDYAIGSSNREHCSVSFPPAFVQGEDKTRKGGKGFSIRKVARNWTGLQYLALAICTIGQVLEREISRLFTVGEYAAIVV